MLVKMERPIFDSLEDRALVWACVEPAIMKIRGKGPDVKLDVYEGLTEGQQALMLFQILYGHARSAAEFYWFACDYLSKPDLWEKQKAACRRFGCGTLLEAYRVIGEALGPRVDRALAEEKEIVVMDLDRDPQLLEDVTCLFELYRAAAGSALSRIAAYIRSNPMEFVEFKSGVDALR